MLRPPGRAKVPDLAHTKQDTYLKRLLASPGFQTAIQVARCGGHRTEAVPHIRIRGGLNPGEGWTCASSASNYRNCAHGVETNIGNSCRHHRYLESYREGTGAGGIFSRHAQRVYDVPKEIMVGACQDCSGIDANIISDGRFH